MRRKSETWFTLIVKLFIRADFDHELNGIALSQNIRPQFR
jgi:hypothetical protein